MRPARRRVRAGCEATFERIKANEAPAQAAAQDAALDYLLAPEEGGR